MSVMKSPGPRFEALHTQDVATKLRDICVRATMDSAFRARVQSDPKGVMAEFGLKLAPGVHVIMVPASPEHLAAAFAGTTREELRLPVITRQDEADTDAALDDAELENVTGGAETIQNQYQGLPLESMISGPLNSYFSSHFENYQHP